jgi:hypothetical protein
VTLWFSVMPTAVSFALMFVVANAIAVGMMLTARALMKRAGIEFGPSVVSAWATVAGGLCALLFAFTVVTLWNGGTKANANVDDEASTIRNVARDLTPVQLPLLRDYVLKTVAGWPQLCGDTKDQAAGDALNIFERTAQPRDKSYADDLFRQLGILEDLRNRRLQAADHSVPSEIVWALTILSLVVLGVLAIAMPDRFGVQAALMLLVGTGLGTLFWVTLVLQYPFCGAGGIPPDELVAILRNHVI